MSHSLNMMIIFAVINQLIFVCVIVLIYLHFHKKAKYKRYLKRKEEFLRRKAMQEGNADSCSCDIKQNNVTKENSKPKKGKKNKVDYDQQLNNVECKLCDLRSDLDNYYKPKPLNELHQEMKSSFLDQEVDFLDKQINDKIKSHPYVTKKQVIDRKYQDKISNLNDQIVSLGGSQQAVSQPKKVKTITELKIGKELDKIKDLLDKYDTEPDTFMGKVKKKFKSKEEIDAEAEAIKLVQKISRMIEGNHPIPPNELLWIKDEVKNLRKDINEDLY
ncbi:hypothetical protein HN385_02895 [archaeon]|nr:hypothetical protein [archaeon]MBT3450574.1 hypothetical protein [archaeon]MBT6868428.1 hypothetical protein [archaeon]MBT7193527.1 hypothetical protein [archaeon]MBT7381278.1 hypothetical protein [archaeon]